MDKMVSDFQRAMGIKTGMAFTPDNVNELALNMKLIREEAYELDDELAYAFMQMADGKRPDNLDKIYKETADLLYVVFHFTNAFGIPIQKVFAEVHRSNLSKLGPDGKPIRNNDGKVMKGPNYRPPNMQKFVEQHDRQLELPLEEQA